ncbi:putative bifunctional diguanylate cyclase/phosphodiesterase [Nocardioides iriomotensis]|uniref:EAL domain-containing protein n=1 Tax=Nocardioides iriomotensis TaxID=715784 RepID=A0A4Q5J3B8_9ACTN|nr:EAL domain-containing protein [Nocardioides iriomotensis]RYU12974.1 EAL domain-containing protein [Nocardioides iriomotensis]
MHSQSSARTRVRVGALVVAVLGSAVFTAAVPFRSRLDARFGADAMDLVLDFGVFNLVYVATAVCVLAVRRGITRRERFGWWALAAALVSSTAGNAWYTLVLVPADTFPYPSPADYLYLAWYPLGYVAIFFLLTARVGRFPLSVWLDGLVAGAGAAALAAAVWFEPLTAQSPGTPLVEIVVNMAYPVFDLLLVCLLLGVAYIVRTAAQAWLLVLGLGFAVTGVADVISAIQIVDGTYIEGGWIDTGWLWAVALLAAACLPRRKVESVDALALVTQRTGGSLRVMAVPLASAAGSLALLQLGQGDRFPPVSGVFAAACILGAGIRAALTFRDLARLADVHREARTDDLTRLANRRELYEAAERALNAAGRKNTPTSLLLIDLDGFKEVNDSLGHAMGDELLVAFARRTEAALRPGDLLARLGGDEFAILASGSDTRAAIELGWRLVASTREPYEVSDVRLSVDVSVGVATLAPHGGSRGDLLRQADVAMYQAKGSPQRVSAFDTTAGIDDDAGGERLALLTRLREGLAGDAGHRSAAGHVELHLQPKVALVDGRLDGVEALARWRDQDGRLLPPAEFLPLVQRGGLLPALAAEVLGGAVRIARELRSHDIQVPVAVNLSAVDIHDQALPGRVATLLAREQVAPSALVVELTEDSLVTDPDAAAGVLSALRELGVRVSLDDFGTGYSSLAYLRRLPVDEVKLDRSFTIGVGVDDDADSVIQHTVGLVHALGLHLVAEGVEDEETAHRLRELGCDTGQGFLWAAPVPLEEFLASPLANGAPGRPTAVRLIG